MKMQTKKIGIGLAAVVAVILIGACVLILARFTKDAPEPIRFSDVKLDQGVDVLNRFSEAHVILYTVSGDQEAVLGLLGARRSRLWCRGSIRSMA
jgi:hypothetical protein